MSELPPGLETARFELRQAGYCVICDAIVERGPEGGCVRGHPAEALSCRLLLSEDEELPRLPRFNVAAFLLPMIWGPAHGLWAGAVFLPILLFMDSVLRTAATNALTRVVAVVVVVVTVAAMAWFAKRANGLAWRRVCDRVSVERYVACQRIWAVASVPFAAALLGMALYFDLVVLPTRGM